MTAKNIQRRFLVIAFVHGTGVIPQSDADRWPRLIDAQRRGGRPVGMVVLLREAGFSVHALKPYRGKAETYEYLKVMRREIVAGEHARTSAAAMNSSS